jgi:hypothetical protein
MNSQHYIFLSPHFDDVALSCGGLVWSLIQGGHTVEIWTLMGGTPPEQTFSPFAQDMHNQWGMPPNEVVATRQAEDVAACKVLGVQMRHFDWLDAIYRRDPKTGTPQVLNDDELFGKPPEADLVAEIAGKLILQIPEEGILVAPISLGNHIDHRAVRAGADGTGLVTFYYADYPYILRNFDDPCLSDGSLVPVPYLLSKGALIAWGKAVLCYRSQLRMFWRDAKEVRLSIKNYCAGGGGRLWGKVC